MKWKDPWKLKNAKIGSVINWSNRNDKNLTKILQTIPGIITTNKLELEAVRGSVMILKRALGTKL